jgi:catechol 2,3-dioxygenase-like lactoylglutathione lyase family enzyme
MNEVFEDDATDVTCVDSKRVNGMRRGSIVRTDHTGIVVQSIDESLHFWVDVLGFELVGRDTFTGDFISGMTGVPGTTLLQALISAPGHTIELLQCVAPDDRQIVKPRPVDVGSVHVAFFVEEIDALLARATTVGWHALGRVQVVDHGALQGTRLAYVRGPDGVTVEFLEKAKGK